MIAYGYSVAGGKLEELKACTITVPSSDWQQTCAALEELVLAAPCALSPAPSADREPRVSSMAYVARISAGPSRIALSGRRRGFGRSRELREVFLLMDDEDRQTLPLMLEELIRERGLAGAGTACAEWHYRFRKAGWRESESDLLFVRMGVAG